MASSAGQAHADAPSSRPAGEAQNLCSYLASNTIIIDSRSARFREQVRAALAEICPCYIITVGADGTVLLQSPVDRAAFCECYCKHLAGCNLIAGLSGNGQTTRIRSTGSGNRHREGTVSWNPNSRSGGRNTRGDRRRPPSVGLAHELAHAQHTHSGQRGQTHNEEEDQATRDENQIRKEMGEPQRTHYGGRRVANPDGGTLDTTDRADCGCQ